MTSANVTHYELYEMNEKGHLVMIDSCQKHALCKNENAEKKIEEWEYKYPGRYLAMRWPDECEADHYLTFDVSDGYDEHLGVAGLCIEEERDLCRIDKFMKRKRIYEIDSKDSTIEWFRKKLLEHTGNQKTNDFNSRKKFHEFRTVSEEIAEDLGNNVRARCWVDEKTGEFHREFLLTCRRAEDVKMAQDAISHFYGTGRVPDYTDH